MEFYGSGIGQGADGVHFRAGHVEERLATLEAKIAYLMAQNEVYGRRLTAMENIPPAQPTQCFNDD